MKKYNYAQKILHKLILSNGFVNKALFEIEKIFFLPSNIKQITNNKHIFITSLPRSGTTAILNFIYENDKYGSLTYGDMPFVMSPNLYSKFKIHEKLKNKERMHKDGLFFNLATPEAFDEIFFSLYKNVNTKLLQNDFLKYISLILKYSNKDHYLSKNNYNYKRINLIKNIFPSSIFISPFRNPLQHAISLLNQHNNFKNLQNADKFVLDYMNFLKHYEFGNNHRPWFKSIKYHDLNSINYWLEQWFLFYSNLIENNKHTFIKFISYEKLCSDQNYLPKFISLLKLNKFKDFSFVSSSVKKAANYDNNLLSKCDEVYNKMFDEQW
jgi:hypothetical protein